MPPVRRTPSSGPVAGDHDVSRPRPTGRRGRTPETGPPRRGRRPTLSLESVLDGAIEILDSEGESALTLRALAKHLDSGIGSLYHYVGSRDELLDRATNEILGRVVSTASLPPDPYEALRALSVESYEMMQRHRWTGLYLMRDSGMQPNSMRLFELFGQQILQLGLTPRQSFEAASSLISFVVGAGTEMRELPASMLQEDKSQETYLREFADRWLELDPEDYPFVHAVAEEFAAHDDLAQFTAGVDLFLAGLRTQAETAARD